MKKNLLIVFLLAVILVILAMNFKFNKQEEAQGVACTMEAKICPDGSAVGRSGPKCEFAACPEAKTNTSTVSVSHEDDKITGKRLVYFRGVKQDGFAALLTVDPIEMFGGEEAIAAAMQDTKCSREKVFSCAGSLNNSFYIRNLSNATQTLNLSLSSDVYLLSSADSSKLEKIGLLDLKKKFDAGLLGDLALSPFWVTVKNGKVSKVEQQYIP